MNQVLNKLRIFWSIIVIIFAWLIISSPYTFQHKIPYPSTFQVSFFSPWSDYKQYQIPTKNNALSDVINQIFPWKQFTISQLKKGQLPLWNPYSFSGNPHLANSQTAVFSPFNLLFFVLPFIDAWSLLILFQPLIAGLGMYAFLRQLRVSKEGSVLASIVFMFCGFITAWMPYGTLSMAIVFLPLALFAVEKNFERIHLPSLLILTVSVAVSFFSGHIQTSVYFTFFVTAYIIFKTFLPHYRFGRDDNLKKFIFILVFFVAGLSLSLIQIIPTLQLYQQAPRSQEFSNDGGIQWQYLITLVAPDFYGNPVTRNDWFGKYAEWSSFIGIVPLMLACIALYNWKNHKSTVLFFAIASLISLILAMDTPLQKVILNLKIPVFSTSIPSRIIVLFSFSLVVLAGVGLDVLKEKLQKKEYKRIFPAIIVPGVVLLLIWISLLGFKFLPQDKIYQAMKNFLLPTFLLLAVGTVLILSKYILAKEKKKGVRIYFYNSILTILLIAALFDSLRFAQKWLPFDEAKYIFPDIPVIKAMQRKVGDGRVYGNFGSYIDTYYQLPFIEGYDPLYNRRYGEFIQSAKTGEWTPAIHSLAILDKQGKYSARVLDLLGVNLLLHKKGDTFTVWTFPVWSDKQRYLKIYEDDKFELYKNTTALPRAKLFYDYEVIKEDRKSIKRFYSDSFDFKNTLLLEEKPTTQKSKAAEGKVTIKKYSPNHILIHVSSTKPGLLFLSDNYYPSWKAFVNNKETKILRADYSFRTVVVPQGESNVEFRNSL